MSKNTKNLIKGGIAFAGTFLATFCAGQDPLKAQHIAGIVVGVATFLWYGWQVFTDD